MTKTFKVAAVSKNSNSFGLAGIILAAADGEAFEVGRCQCGAYPEPWIKGQSINIPFILNQDRTPSGLLEWGSVSCEISRKLPKCPANVLAELFPGN